MLSTDQGFGADNAEETQLQNTFEKATAHELTDWELEVVTKVFRSFETGLRDGTILPKVSLGIL